MSEERPTFLLSARCLFWGPVSVHPQPRQRARRGHHQNVQIDINPHARFGINVVSRLGPSANLSRLTRTRILRPPKVGKRKRDATTKMGRQDEDGPTDNPCLEFLRDGQRTQDRYQVYYTVRGEG